MEHERWQHIEQVYHTVLTRDISERRAFLHQVCAGDEALEREVESLLVHQQKAESFIEEPALELAAVSMARNPTTLAGRQIGPYHVLSLIGEGGMGQVYRARDTKLGREVAIKVLPPELSSNQSLLARLEKEARLASALNHPNIITIYAIEQIDSTLCVVMELVEGKTLRDVLDDGLMPMPTALEIAVQIATGLAKAHEAGIVHRDLKPQNVMISQDSIVKILDFGLGKFVRTADRSVAEMRTLARLDLETQPGTLLGTVYYMSPQQASGRPVDFRADQFAFGVMLYEMITAKRPFERPTAAQTLASIIQDEPESVTALNPAAPVALQRIIERCLAKDPERRYRSTGDLSQELREVRDNVSNARGGAAFSLFDLRHFRRWQVWFVLLLAALLIARGAAFIAPSVFKRFAAYTASVNLPSEKQLAILPFANVSNEPGDQAFSDGLVEILTSKLTQLEQFQQKFQVVPASETRRERISSVREARQTFGVTLAITGSVQRAETHVLLTVNLVDARTLRQLRARVIDTENREISAMQDRVVLEVVDLLDVRLPLRAKQLLSAGGTTVPSAYEYYTQGRGYLQRYEQVENIETAIELFKRALVQDPKYALAQAGLGEAYWRRYEATKDPQWAEQAATSCSAALKLNNDLPQVNVTLGMIQTGTGKYEEAVRNLLLALSLDPMNPDAYRELARAYQALGKLQEAESTYKRAIAARPSFWGNHNELGKFYFRSGRYAEAETQFRRILQLTPDNSTAYNNLGAMYYSQRRYEEAAAMFEKLVAMKPSAASYSNLGTTYFYQKRYSDAARTIERALTFNNSISKYWYNLAAAYQWAPGESVKAGAAFRRAAELAEQESRINPRDPDLLSRLADCYSMLDQHERSRRLLRRALILAPNDVNVMFQAAVVYEQLGDRTRALEWIGKAVQNGYSRDLIQRSPSLAQLRADARFQGIFDFSKEQKGEGK